ncbi:MAG: hypothetical protein AAF447_13765 [Myxococcota bacterium]
MTDAALPPELEGKTFLLTGGAGFIGTALTRRLVAGARVRILDVLRRNALAMRASTRTRTWSS